MAKKEDVKETVTPEVETDDGLNEQEEITVDDLIKKLAELKVKVEEEKKRADEMTKVAITLRADFDNFRKRTREESFKEREKGNVDVLEKIIPVLDVVEQATQMIKDENVKKGVEMIRDQMLSLLASYKVEEIDAKGKDFDPKLHEAIMQIDGNAEDSGKVSEVFQKGYKMGEKIIRAARVIVFK